MQKLIILALMLSTYAWSAANHSKCSNFLSPEWGSNDSPGGGWGPPGGMGGGIGGFGPLGYLPFDMDAQGKISPHDDVSSFAEDDNGNVTIMFEMPSFIPDNNPATDVNPYKQKMRNVLIEIKKDDSGNIQELIFDQNYTEEEIAA